MRKKNELPKYESPSARDLTGLSARGDGPTPMGICTTGSTPSVYTCSPVGSMPKQDPAACTPYGLAAGIGKCSTGHVDATGCGPGSYP